jgi:hypothetical protein
MTARVSHKLNGKTERKKIVLSHHTAVAATTAVPCVGHTLHLYESSVAF